MFPSACGGSVVSATGEASLQPFGAPYRQTACNGLSARVPRDLQREKQIAGIAPQLTPRRRESHVHGHQSSVDRFHSDGK